MGRYTDALKAEIASYVDSTWSGEVGGQQLILSAGPLSTKDMTWIRRQYPDFQVNPSLAGMIELIIMKARDPDGEKAFDLTDKPFLSRLATNRVGEIFGALFGDQFEPETEAGFEERKKK